MPYDVGTSYEANPHAARTPPNATGAAVAQYYAVDLLMPIGTPVVAARSGTVVRIEESFADGDKEVGHENFVVVDQGDGSFARCFHLTNQGALVATGANVVRGERIAASGNTGNTSGPHLHFDVVDTRCDVLQASVTDAFRLCPTAPVSFRNTQASSCGLLAGISYTALPFQ